MLRAEMPLLIFFFLALHHSCRSIGSAEITEKKMEPTFTYGDTMAELSCTLTLPKNMPLKKLNVTWTKEGAPLSQLGNSWRFKVDSTNGSLFISKPTRDDAGLYTAHFVDVPTMDKHHNCLVRYLAGPLILHFPKSKNVFEGDPLELRCMVKGYPPATVSWFRDKKLLTVGKKNDSRIKLMPNNGYPNAFLKINKAAASDAGVYQCVAHSKYFNVSTSKELIIRVTDRMAFAYPLGGLIVGFIMLCTIICIFESSKKSRIQKEEAKLYRESFVCDEARGPLKFGD